MWGTNFLFFKQCEMTLLKKIPPLSAGPTATSLDPMLLKSSRWSPRARFPLRLMPPTRLARVQPRQQVAQPMPRLHHHLSYLSWVGLVQHNRGELGWRFSFLFPPTQIKFSFLERIPSLKINLQLFQMQVFSIVYLPVIWCHQPALFEDVPAALQYHECRGY